MTIEYTLKLLSDWNCSSGLSSGAEADSITIKDDNGLPYVPGKTIKGLLKNALLEMAEADDIYNRIKEEYLGQDAVENKNKGAIPSKEGKAYFSSATLTADEKQELITYPTLIPHLFRNISQTKIDEHGIAEQKSLRTTQVCMPLTLVGTVEAIETNDDAQKLMNAFKWIRHLGMNRNRGLGRCQFICTIK